MDSPLPVGLTPFASSGLICAVLRTLGWTGFLDWTSRLDFWTFRLDSWTSGLDFWAFVASQDALLRAFWGPTGPSWTPKCTHLMDWTSSLDFWTFRLHFGLLSWTFWIFLLLAEHAGASVCAMKSALPDFGIYPSLVLSRHQIVKDFLHFVEPIFGKKSPNFNPTFFKIVFEVNFCKKWLLEMCFLTLKPS